MIFVVRRMNLPYAGCLIRRSTETVTLLFILLLTTRPMVLRTTLVSLVCSALIPFSSFSPNPLFHYFCWPLLLLALVPNGLQPRDVLAHLAVLVGLRALTRDRLHPQVELLAPQLEELFAELLVGQVSQLFRLHQYAVRLMNEVFTDSF